MKTFYQDRKEEYSARLTVNNSYPSHLHRQVEIIYVTKGHLTITIDDKCATLGPGDMSICFPSRQHNTHSISDSSAILMIFNPEFAGEFATELMHKAPSSPFISKADIPMEVTLAIKALEECYARKKDPRIAQGHLMVILGNLFPHIELKSNDPGDGVDTCKQIIDYVTEHYANDITLDTIAHDLGLSKYYISHIFSERIKMSFPNYLGRCRAEHAAKLLKTTSMSVTDIGYASGFNSNRTFYRAFQQVYEMTPQEYRNS